MCLDKEKRERRERERERGQREREGRGSGIEEHFVGSIESFLEWHLVRAEFLMSLKLWVNKARQICNQKRNFKENRTKQSCLKVVCSQKLCFYSFR